MFGMSMRTLCFGAIVLACGASPANVQACEDEHPPVAVEPVAEFVLGSPSKARALSLAVDPRGVRAVVPPGDDVKTWIHADDSAGAWHYREWQWWKGHPWGDSCRPRYWTQAQLHARRQPPASATISYSIDGFDCQQTFLLPAEAEASAPHWDLVTTIRNVSKGNVQEYGQFFACYTPLNRGRSFWYWDASDRLVLFAERGVSHLDGYIANPEAYFAAEGAVPHCPRGGGKIVETWRHPVFVSQASPAGWRSIILLETAHAAALTQGIQGGAMDYILLPSPEERAFADGAAFSAHIRHVLLKSPDLPPVERLEELWDEFVESHAATRLRAERAAASDEPQTPSTAP
jgi:hypothetical protein